MNRRAPLQIACLVLLMAASGCIAKPEFTGRVKVLTYDADDPEYLTHDISSLIREADADVVCVQEARSGWCRAFKREFRWKYPASLFVDPGFLGISFGKQPAFFSKYALRAVQYVPPAEKRQSSDVWIVEAQTPAGLVQIANVRLRGQTHIDTVMAAVNSKSPSLIVGEFQGGRDDWNVRRAASKGYTDVLPLFDAKTPTWRVRQLVIVKRAQRDHILCSSHFEAVAARVLSTRASDHSPVWAELKLVDKTTQPAGETP